LRSSLLSFADRALPVRTLAGLIVATVTVALIALFTYRALEAREEAASRLRQADATLERLAAVMTLVRDAETSQRGFLLTGDDRYLAPYAGARAALPATIETLRQSFPDGSTQARRATTLVPLAAEKLGELDRTIALYRAGERARAIALVRTDEGEVVMERIRSTVAEMQAEERREQAARQEQWHEAVASSNRVTWGGSALLVLFILMAAVALSRDHRSRETQLWLRKGQTALSTRLQGEQRLDTLGARVMEFLAEYLDAHAGVAYLVEGDGRFRRFAAYGIAADAAAEWQDDGTGLLAEVARHNRSLHVTDVPPGYLTVSSGLGRATATQLLLAPASIDGIVQAVIELGFFRTVTAPEQELLARASDVLGVAVRGARDRSRLEALLEETQQQRESLQTQQEELRVNNEELEEQSRALRESQTRLEAQQASLEHVNTLLEEQTAQLEEQKDTLLTAQATLTAKAEELERANQYKSEFLANMSHELRTPLNSALILAKLLADNKDGNLTPEQVKFAQTISSAGKDLLALINDILDLSKVEAGKVDIVPERLHLARTVDGVVRIFEPLMREKGLTLGVTVEPGTPEHIETDAQRLGQILRNLLSNAVKFTDRGEVAVLIRAEEGEGEGVSIAVRDTGIGIPEHQQGIVFEAFRQADGSTHRKYGGTGLGLSISRDLARLMGGDLRLRSTPGEGSVFTLTLPRVYAAAVPAGPVGAVAAAAEIASARAPVAAAAAPPPLAPALAPRDDRDQLEAETRRILVIEDDEAFAGILRDLAHELGFHCILTHNAADGVAAAVRFRPSAILLDVQLPDGSGLGVLEQLKRDSRTRHVPVHVVSVEDYAHEALERGAIGYALKPVARDQLVAAIHQLEAKFSQTLRRVLVVEDDARQRDSIRQLLTSPGVEIVDAADAQTALTHLADSTFDCMVMDLNLPDLSGYELLEQMAGQEHVSFPPVIVYTGRALDATDEQRLGRFSKSIIIKDARSPERLLDEVTLFLHQVESTLPAERQRMLKVARDRETALDGRRVLVVEDDARNIFALASILEPKGAKVDIARNGREALAALARAQASPASRIDLVLMDIMMPEMDGLTAMREIRKDPRWVKLPIIALTAKAMKDDQERCLEAGANDYIAKPLDVERLLSLVRVWMPK
jgi:signal transduction histidine kinase/DNA-binding response OmpR family regulator/CHASE3 domain sensor protein